MRRRQHKEVRAPPGQTRRAAAQRAHTSRTQTNKKNQKTPDPATLKNELDLPYLTIIIHTKLTAYNIVIL